MTLWDITSTSTLYSTTLLILCSCGTLWLDLHLLKISHEPTMKLFNGKATCSLFPMKTRVIDLSHNLPTSTVPILRPPHLSQLLFKPQLWWPSSLSMPSWQNGDIDTLLYEGRTIQNRLRFNVSHPKPRNLSKSFSSNVQRTSQRCSTSPLQIKWQRRPFTWWCSLPQLRSYSLWCPRIKTPSSPTPTAESIVHSDVEGPEVHPIVFERIDAECIRKSALHTYGAGWPSRLDAHSWRRLCSSFGKASLSLSRPDGQEAMHLTCSSRWSKSLSCLPPDRLWQKTQECAQLESVMFLEGSLLKQYCQLSVVMSWRQLVLYNFVQARLQEVRQLSLLYGPCSNQKNARGSLNWCFQCLQLSKPLNGTHIQSICPQSPSFYGTAIVLHLIYM